MTRRQGAAAARRIPWGKPVPDDVADALRAKVDRQLNRACMSTDDKACRRDLLRLAMGA